MALTRMRRRLFSARRAKPSSARLLASVAPEVKITSSPSQPISRATDDAASRTVSAARQPMTWSVEWGLPKASFQCGTIFA